MLSKSKYFHQSVDALKIKRVHLENVLNDFEVKDIDRWLRSYDYFVFNPWLYDGTTIVKDLQTIKGLSMPACNHDYAYLTDRSNWINPIKKIKCDWQYAKDLETVGHSTVVAYSRAILLILTTPMYWVYKFIKIWL